MKQISKEIKSAAHFCQKLHEANELLITASTLLDKYSFGASPKVAVNRLQKEIDTHLNTCWNKPLDTATEI